MLNNYPEFYVSEPSWELADRSANYLIIRNGEMRIKDTRNGEIYRYTTDLFRAGITEGNLYELINAEILELIDNPWFEVWNSENNPNDFESDALHEFSDAERLVRELELEITNA